MGGGLCAFDLRRGEGGRGHQPARQHRRQPEAQKRPRSLPVHSGSPSLVDVELRRIYRFRPRSATMSHPLKGATRQVLTFAMRSGRRRRAVSAPFALVMPSRSGSPGALPGSRILGAGMRMERKQAPLISAQIQCEENYSLHFLFAEITILFNSSERLEK